MILNTKELITVNPFIANLQINGTIYKNNSETPTKSLIRVYNKKTGRLLSQGYSKEDGSYTLFGSSIDYNYIVAIDETKEFNSTIKDNIK